LRGKRGGVCFLLVFVLAVMALPITAYASSVQISVPVSSSSPIEITPFWNNTNSITLSTTISSGTATCTATIIGKPNATKITASFCLESKNSNGTWSGAKTWDNVSSNSSVLTWSGKQSVTSGVTYRLKCDAVVTMNGIPESVTVYSAERKA